MGQTNQGGRKVGLEIRRAWRGHPDTPYDLIIRVEGNPSERSLQLEAHGVEIRRRHWLTPTLSVRCTGRTALGLLDFDWIVRIEPDRPVRAIGGQGSER
ncbi:MAG: hypothetical protein JXA74_16320 [Anaerolineae bacterium]|nr:hypothetical protein [Anaerolineae bacterium]